MTPQTPEQYLKQLPADRKQALSKLRESILGHLPHGFTETMGYGTIGYVVPLSIYPNGYHVDPQLPLPFINIASQKNFIALYHLGMYADKDLLDWFVAAYPKHVKTKLDMGKSCIRFKNMETIPYRLIEELASRMTTESWINIYEANIKK